MVVAPAQVFEAALAVEEASEVAVFEVVPVARLVSVIETARPATANAQSAVARIQIVDRTEIEIETLAEAVVIENDRTETVVRVIGARVPVENVVTVPTENMRNADEGLMRIEAVMVERIATKAVACFAVRESQSLTTIVSA